MTILYIGNFEPPFSTENDRAWSFNQLGHHVLAVQENLATVEKLEELISDEKKPVHLVVYSHTHGWEIPNLRGFFELCKAKGIPTASVHLDRWAWLARETDIGKEATWFTEYLFMADGSPEAVELYEAHNLNWHFLKPGVVARDCYMAEPDRDRFPHDVIFVGSRGYHPEHPFRKKLIDFLRRMYGDSFGLYGPDGIGTIRGADLNTLYASAKVVVGDSCFGGRPNYVSDRYFETRGRGGFLLHPHTEGFETHGVGHYGMMDLSHLQLEVDFFLERDHERKQMLEDGFNWVKDHETYTHRAEEMLKIIFPKGEPVEVEKEKPNAKRKN